MKKERSNRGKAELIKERLGGGHMALMADRRLNRASTGLSLRDGTTSLFFLPVLHAGILLQGVGTLATSGFRLINFSLRTKAGNLFR